MSNFNFPETDSLRTRFQYIIGKPPRGNDFNYYSEKGTSQRTPNQNDSMQIRGCWFPYRPSAQGIFITKLSGVTKELWTYSFFVIHVFMASSTARERSPFFPPNRSTVFNLSCFSSSPGRSTLIRPTFIVTFC
jgi:hypothetical protein